jgi:RNA polymerase sigma-70 factor (ECF subfamily)
MSNEKPRDGSEQARDPETAKEGALLTSLSLLHRARSREQAAWDRLFYLYQPLVLYWCSSFGVRHEDADDVTQEVFRELTDSLSSFQEDRPGGTFRGWLRGITRNRILMHFRRAGKHAQAAGGSAALARLEQVADQRDEGEGEGDAAEQISGLYHRGLELVRAEFEERTWQMFWQTVVDGRTPGAVAADLGVSDAAVRQAKSRVLRRLKEEVGDLIK